MMNAIKVKSSELLESIKAFQILFKRTPEIQTCNRFDDITGCPVFGFCKVVEVKTKKFSFKADGEIHKAYISACECFYLS